MTEQRQTVSQHMGYRVRDFALRIGSWSFWKRRVITGCHGSVLFTRWILVECPLGKLMIHRFHRSDADRELHDHPWNFRTLILWGGYWEEIPQGLPGDPSGTVGEPPGTRMFWRRPGSLLFRPATWAHSVRLRPGTEGRVWTLVWTGPRVREWGFWTKAGWIDWLTFGKTRNCD